MKIKFDLSSACYAAGLIALGCGSPVSAAITPVDSVVAGTPANPPYELESITVGGYTVTTNDLAVGITEALPGGNDMGTFFDTWPPPFDPPAPCSTFDINQILARNQNPDNPVIVRNFGGAEWTNSNGANPDFFIFEAAAGGNVDGDVTVQAILPGDVLGMAVSLPAGSWGDTGLARVGDPNNGHAIKGVAFSVTDLLDAGGTALPETALLVGLRVNSAGVDPSLIAAVSKGMLLLPPRIANVVPADGAAFYDEAAGISFSVFSDEAIPSANIGLKLNGSYVTGLVFTGDANAWDVSYAPLQAEVAYTAEMLATNSAGVTTITISFDTFTPSGEVTEAFEPFDEYPVGQTLINQDGGTGWGGAWVRPAGNNPANVVDTSGDPLIFSPAGSAPIEGNGAAVQLSGTANQPTIGRPLVEPISTNFYVSYLIRVAAGTWAVNNTCSLYLSDSVNNLQTTPPIPFTFGIRSSSTAGNISSTNHFMIRIGTGNPVAGGAIGGLVEPGRTYLLVARVSKLDANGDPTSTFDRMEMWLDPAVDSVTTDPTGHARHQLAAGAGLPSISHLFVRLAALQADNLVQIDELRVTEDWPLVPGLGRPNFSNISPANNASQHDPAAGISFTVNANEPIPSSNIGLSLNGEAVTGLNITGGPTTWNVSYAPLSPNVVYTAVMTATNSVGVGSATRTFDTFQVDQAQVIEAEDFNFTDPWPGGTPGQFFDNVVLCNTLGGGTPDCYFDRVGTPGIDEFESAGLSDNNLSAFNDIYRWGPGFLEPDEQTDTFTSGDVPFRSKFVEPYKDYDVTSIRTNDWLNYTRTFSNAVYTIYLRVRSTAAQEVSLGKVSNPTSPSQTVGQLGTFKVPSTAGGYRFVPLTDAGGNSVPVLLNGVETLRLTAEGANNNMQWNYLMLIPAPPRPAYIGSVAPADGATNLPPNTPIEIELVNASTTVQLNSITLLVDGMDVSGSASKTPTPTGLSVVYDPGVLSPGPHTASISFQDSMGAVVSSQWQFEVLTAPVLPAAWAAPMGSVADRGFNVRSAQTTDPVVATNLPRTLERAEDQLAGRVQVDFTGTDTPNVINYTERGDIANQGFFTAANGFADRISQDVGLIAADNHENHATEVTFFMPLDPGYYQLGANVNDSVRFAAGRGAANVPESFPLILAERPGEGAATAGQPQFPANFIVTTAGVYAFRVVWAEYVSSSSLEIHVKDSDGDSHLLNDDALVNGKPSPLQAYRTRTVAPPVPARATIAIAHEADGSLTFRWSGTGFLQSAPAVTGPWTTVNPQTNPYAITPTANTFYRVVE